MGTWALVMGAIAITAIITEHLQKQSKIKNKSIKEELELEKIKQENYLLETEKLRLELQHRISEESMQHKNLPKG